MKIFIASGNLNKIKEIKAIISASAEKLDLDLHSIQGMDIPEPAEPYQTFMENARHKAQYYADYLGAPTLSEDAGLCIETLDDFPGVITKDFLVHCGSLEHAFANLEHMLIGKTNYSASFICAAALYIPIKKQFITCEGKVFGEISFPARGDKGFGFDPIFVPSGYNKTLAELGLELKNVIGHRAIAIRGIAKQLSQKGYND